MTIEQTVEIPADRRLTLEVPPEIPAGKAVLAFTPVPAGPPEDGPPAEDEFDRICGFARTLPRPEGGFLGMYPSHTIKIHRSCKLKLPDAVIAATAVILNATLLSNDDHFHSLIWPGLSVRRATTSTK